MRYLNFAYYDDNDLLLLDSESDELTELVIQFKKLSKYELVQDLIVTKVNKITNCYRIQDWVEELDEDYFRCLNGIKGEYEIFIKIKEMIKNDNIRG